MAKPMQASASEAGNEPYYSVTVDSTGRVLIPAPLRKRFGLTPGTVMVVHGQADESVSFRTPEAAIREAQNYYRARLRPGELLSEELIRERHAEAKREYGD